LLAGAPRREIGDRTICACFGVGLATLRAAIADRGLSSAEDVGRALRAGTNCGSCLPEIRALLPARAAEAA
jgi:assimilatory nitrate reductase catalytic subunit